MTSDIVDNAIVCTNKVKYQTTFAFLPKCHDYCFNVNSSAIQETKKCLNKVTLIQFISIGENGRHFGRRQFQMHFL